MGALAHQTAFVQHQDLVCVQHSGDALCHNDNGSVIGLGFQCTAQGNIGLKVEGRKAVVEQINFGVLGNGACNGKALLLAAGHIGAALCNGALVALGLCVDELGGLRNGSSLFRIGIGDVLPAELQVRVDGAAEQHALLGHIAQQVVQLCLRHIAHIDAVHGHAAAGDIIKAGDEVEQAPRRPKGLAIIAEFGGVVTIKDTKKKREIIVTDQETGNSKTYLIPYGSRIKVADGQVLEAGDVLTEGSINPHDLLKVKGVRAVQDYMIREVQRVYRLQGVEINDKHIEMIVRQMLKKIRVEESGDSDVLPGVSMDVLDFNEMNEELIAAGKQPAEGKQVMLGITKASLATDSFLSAASFQETTKVLTEAAINGKVDHLIGLKENVIIGKLIPAGTGMKRYRNIKLSTGEIEDKIQEQEAPVAEEPQEETDAPLEEADKIILNEDDTQDVDE